MRATVCLQCNQTGGTSTITHLPEDPIAKKRSQWEGAGKTAGGIHGCRATAAGLVFGAVAQGQGQPGGPGGVCVCWVCVFHFTSENSQYAHAEVASCYCESLIQSLTHISTMKGSWIANDLWPLDLNWVPPIQQPDVWTHGKCTWGD